MKTLAETIGELPVGERLAVESRTNELVAEELALRTLGEHLGLTQDEMADRLESSRENTSRSESRDDVRLSTLRRCVQALGGTLHVTAHFPDRSPIELVDSECPDAIAARR